MSDETGLGSPAEFFAALDHLGPGKIVVEHTT